MKPRILALYLPQFHPVPENDQWWGPGFTEWTNVAKARPLFRGHHQPRIPADLGFYDLRLPETREAQAQMAREAGIEAFCYYHYWFEGKQLLERPFDEVLSSGKPDFPFCLCWANHSWSNKTWNRKSNLQANSMLMEQTYSREDDVQHFMHLLPAFRDERYVRIDGKPVFVLYEPFRHPHVQEWITTWRELAVKNGLPGLYLIGMTPSILTLRLDAQGIHEGERVMPNLASSADIYNVILQMGFDAVNSFGKRRGELLGFGRIKELTKTALRRFGLPVGKRYDYAKTVAHYFAPEDTWENVFPTILPQWDRTPRMASYDGVYVGATPEAFEQHIRQAMDIIKAKQPEHQVLFLKSWNEWGEGNYVEPDQEFGHGWLDAIRSAITEENKL